MTTVDLGLPAGPPPTLAPRRPTRQINVGGVLVGGGAPVSVQSMTTTLTADVNATLQQIAALTATGCQIVRVAVPSSGRRSGQSRSRPPGRSPILASASVLTGNTSSRRPQEPVARQ